MQLSLSTGKGLLIFAFSLGAVLYLATGCASKTIPQNLLAPQTRQPATSEKFKVFRELDLFRILRSESTKTVNGVLREIKKDFPEKMANPVMVFNSKSLQGASFQNPRAILAGLPIDSSTPGLRPVAYDRLISGDLIFSFNGSPDQDGYNALETMHFDDVQKKFIFREIIFKKDGAAPDYLASDKQFESRDFIISKPNPQRCLQCHGEESPHPIFETYPNWPGVYFSNVETRDFSQVANSSTVAIGKLLTVSRNNREEAEWEKFKTKLKFDSRYSMLKFQPTPLNLNPNTNLNVILEFANAKRIAHIIASNPNVSEFIAVIKTALTEYAGDFFERSLMTIPVLQKNLRSKFSGYYLAERQATDEEINILGIQNLESGTLLQTEPDKQKFISYYSDKLKVNEMSLLDKVAFKQAVTFSGAVSMAVLTALDEKNRGALLTSTWSMSFRGAQPFRSVYDTTQDDIISFLGTELSEKDKVGLKEISYEDAMDKLAKYFR